jgi:hypothetical protein
MGALLVFVALPFLLDLFANPRQPVQAVKARPVKLIRPVSEDEVIAEFLRSDFNGAEFRDYQETLREVVVAPNFADTHENAKRRALLFLRHLSLWREIPTGTEWYEIEVNEADLSQIRVFPRAQWRKLAKGDFSITEVAGSFPTRQHLVDKKFLLKIDAIGKQLLEKDPGFSAVLLIGLNDSEPMTVLDGNHRLAAAVLASPPRLAKLRFFCGLSPRMVECCWYNTNFVSLLRYGKNKVAHATRNPATELARLLQSTG